MGLQEKSADHRIMQGTHRLTDDASMAAPETRAAEKLTKATDDPLRRKLLTELRVS